MPSFLVSSNSLNWTKCSQTYQNEEIWFADGLQAKGQWGATATKMIHFRERTENDPPSETNGMIVEEFNAESLADAQILALRGHLAELKGFLQKWFKVTDLDFSKEILDGIKQFEFEKSFPKNFFNDFDLKRPKSNLPYKFKFFFENSTLNGSDPNITTGIDHG